MSKNLSGAQLINTHFGNFILEHTKLDNAILTGSTFAYTAFTDTDLKMANFSHTILVHVTFTNAQLDHANFSHAKLSKVDFSVIHNADLATINFSKAELRDVTMPDGEHIIHKICGVDRGTTTDQHRGLAENQLNKPPEKIYSGQCLPNPINN